MLNWGAVIGLFGKQLKMDDGILEETVFGCHQVLNRSPVKQKQKSEKNIKRLGDLELMMA